MNALQRLRAWIQPGRTFRTVENTYRPEMNGTTRVITKAGVTRYLFAQVGGPTNCHSQLPTRAGDVEWLAENTVRYKIGRDHHTVTLTLVTEPA